MIVKINKILIIIKRKQTLILKILTQQKGETKYIKNMDDYLRSYTTRFLKETDIIPGDYIKMYE